MNLPSHPRPKITTIQFFCVPNYIMCVSFLASVQFSYLQEMPCTVVKVRGKSPFGGVRWFAVAKQQLLQYQRCALCPCAGVLGVTDREVRERLAAAALSPYLLVNIAVVCTTFGSSVCICMIIHPTHFPWRTRGSGGGGSSGWHPQAPAPACTLAAREGSWQ